MSASVATADEVEALVARLARLEAEVAELRAGRAVLEALSPKEIARRFKIRAAEVYAACSSGALIAEHRPARGGVAYYITLEHARAWRAAVGKTNQ